MQKLENLYTTIEVKLRKACYYLKICNTYSPSSFDDACNTYSPSSLFMFDAAFVG